MILWAEAADSSIVTGDISSRAGHGELMFSKLRRFVVIREGSTYYSALPIATYGGTGVAREGITKSEHAIIYTSRTAPSVIAAGEPNRGELGMRPASIRISTDYKEDKLDPRSRLNFTKIYNIQHNIKVKSYGRVHDRSLGALLQQFNDCWYAASVSSNFPVALQATQTRPQVEPHADTAGRGESSTSGRRSQFFNNESPAGHPTAGSPQLANAPHIGDEHGQAGENLIFAQATEQVEANEPHAQHISKNMERPTLGSHSDEIGCNNNNEGLEERMSAEHHDSQNTNAVQPSIKLGSTMTNKINQILVERMMQDSRLAAQ